MSKNIGDQIRDAVQDAVNSQDYSTLQRTIEQSISIAANNIGKGLAQAQVSINQAQNEYEAAYRREQEKHQNDLTMQNLYLRSNGMRASSIAMTGGGALLLMLFLPVLVIFIIDVNIACIIFTALCAAAGGFLLGKGVSRLNLLSKFDRYRRIIGVRQFCYLQEIATSTGDKPENVLKNIKAMLNKGYFKQASLDDTETFLIMTRSAYQEYREAQNEAAERKRKRDLADSVNIESNEPQPLTPEVQALLARGEAYVLKIRMYNDAIPGEEISRTLDQIEHVVHTIFERAEEQPEVIDDLGQMMDYYLPTTIKLLDAYCDLDKQPIQSETIVQSKREIEGALESLNTAFEKLLDSIFRDVAWDVSTDVSVLHTVLSQEGLVDNPFEKKSV